MRNIIFFCPNFMQILQSFFHLKRVPPPILFVPALAQSKLFQFRVYSFISCLLCLLFSIDSIQTGRFLDLIFSLIVMVLLLFLTLMAKFVQSKLCFVIFILDVLFTFEVVEFLNVDSSFILGYLHCLWQFQMLPLVDCPSLKSAFIIFNTLYLVFKLELSKVLSLNGLMVILLLMGSMFGFFVEQRKTQKIQEILRNTIRETEIVHSIMKKGIPGVASWAILKMESEEILIKSANDSFTNFEFHSCGMDRITAWESIDGKKSFQEELRTVFREKKNPEEVKYVLKERHKKITVVLRAVPSEGEFYIFLTVSNFVNKEVDEQFETHLLSSISHNLKTPLNAIMNMVVLLLGRPYLIEEVKVYLQDIKVNSELLSYEISNVMDYGLLLAKKLTLFVTEIQIKSLVFDIFGLFQGAAENKKISLSYEINWDGLLVNDIQRIKQVLVNLICNALKFTFEGTVKLVISKENEEEILFEVCDSGIGMTDSVQSSLFKLSSSNKAHARQHGIGIGLTVSQKLVGMLGSKEKIEFHSDIGKGSKFSFTAYHHLPSYSKASMKFSHIYQRRETRHHSSIKPALLNSKFHSEILLLKKGNRNPVSFIDLKPENNGTESPSINEEFLLSDRGTVNYPSKYTLFPERSSGEDSEERRFLQQMNRKRLSSTNKSIDTLDFERKGSHKHILLVDDTIYNLIILEKYIESINGNCNVEKAFHGKQAIDIIKTSNSKFDLILMDCNMPVLDGYQTAKILKKMMQDKEIDNSPIIAVSAYNKESEENRWLENGMDDFLEKPISKHSFEELWNKWVENLR